MQCSAAFSSIFNYVRADFPKCGDVDSGPHRLHGSLIKIPSCMLQCFFHNFYIHWAFNYLCVTIAQRSLYPNWCSIINDHFILNDNAGVCFSSLSMKGSRPESYFGKPCVRGIQVFSSISNFNIVHCLLSLPLFFSVTAVYRSLAGSVNKFPLICTAIQNWSGVVNSLSFFRWGLK